MYCQKCGAQIVEGAKFCAKCGHEVGAAVIPAMEPATTGKRLINFILDRIFAYIGAWIIMLVGILIGFLVSSHGIVYAIFVIVAALFYLFGYYVLFEAVWQRTPAKWITRTKVVKSDGSKPKVLRILGRTLCRSIPFEAFSFLFGSNPVGWHDDLSHTLVVPSEYTADDIKKIDLAKKGGSSKVAVVIAIVFGGLVFIATIGVLATVVLTSLGGARSQANDAKIESSFSSARAQAELYYSANNDSYAGVCTSATGIRSLLETAGPAEYAGNNGDQAHAYVCNDSAGAWAASAQLSQEDEAGHVVYDCVDSTGVSAKYPYQLSDGQTSCDVSSQ